MVTLTKSTLFRVLFSFLARKNQNKFAHSKKKHYLCSDILWSITNLDAIGRPLNEQKKYEHCNKGD